MFKSLKILIRSKQKVLRRLYKSVLHLIILAVIVSTGLLLWLNFAWPRYIDRNALAMATKEINDSESLPERFYKVYDRIYPNKRHTKVLKTITLGNLSSIFNGYIMDKYASPTYKIGHITYLGIIENEGKIHHKFSPIYASFALNKYTTPEKCFDYYLHNFDFLFGSIGIYDASNFYFNKNLNLLNEKEIVGLIVMLQNPAIYNPIRNPKKFKEEVKKILCR